MRVEKAANRRMRCRHVTTAILALLLLLAAHASASEGYISLYYSIEGVGESSYTLNHRAGASEGLDDQDTIWYFIACLTCKTDALAVASVEDEDVKIDTRPLESESGAAVRCGVVSRNGDPITVNNAAQWVDVYMYGFDGYDVTVNGQDARTIGRINLPPVTGTYSSGSTLETFDISFSRNPDYEPVDPPIPPNPNPDPTGQEPAPNKPDPDTLFITNQIKGCPQNRTGVWTLKHRQNALDAMDGNDVAYTRPAGGGFNSSIVSTMADPSTKARYLLAVDARSPKSVQDIDLSVGVESDSGQPVQFASLTENKLIFSFPVGAKDCFAGKPLTFQRYDLANPNVTYPVWDIRKIIQANQGILALEDLREYRSSGVPYLTARISTSRQLGDVLRDGRVDVNDYRLIVSQQGFTGPADADIAGPNGLGLPDGKVDAWDLHFVYTMLTAADKSKVTAPVLPVLMEGFETGDLSKLDWYSLQWPRWFVTSEDRHSGTYSARAGRISDDESTSLTVTVNCTAGEIRFWRRVSCEFNWDSYRFYIDNRLQEKLSGEVAWSEVAFPVTAGLRTFRWEFEKDDASSEGKDTVYIDDVVIPRPAIVRKRGAMDGLPAEKNFACATLFLRAGRVRERKRPPAKHLSLLCRQDVPRTLHAADVRDSSDQ